MDSIRFDSLDRERHLFYHPVDEKERVSRRPGREEGENFISGTVIDGGILIKV
jgi:hypothetical protein